MAIEKNAAEVIREKLDAIEQTVMEKVEQVEKKLGDTDGNIRKEMTEKLGEMKATIEKQAEQLNAVNRNSLSGVEEEKKKFSFARYASLVHPQMGAEVRDLKEYGFEKEVMDNMLKRQQTAGDSTAGGYLVPTELSDMIIEPAIAAMPLYSIGMTTLNGVSGTFDIPTMSSRGSSGHAAENGSSNEVSMVFGKYTMTPKRAAGYVKVSKRLLRQASAGVETFIRNELMNTMRIEMHRGLVNGSGSSGEPTGICQQTGFTSTTAIGNAQFTLKHAAQMKTNLEEADVDIEGGSMGFLTRPIIMEGMKMERTIQYSGQTAGMGYAIIPAILNDAELADRIGARIAKTTQVPTSGSGAATYTQVVYGDWSKFIMAIWNGLDIMSSDVASDSSNNAFIQNMVFIRAEQEYDCVCVRPDAFTKISDALAVRTNWGSY